MPGIWRSVWEDHEALEYWHFGEVYPTLLQATNLRRLTITETNIGERQARLPVVYHTDSDL